MKSVKKSTLALIAVFFVIIAISVPTFIGYRKAKNEEQIATSYELQNDAFFITGEYVYVNIKIDGATYQAYENIEFEPLLYAWTLIYEQETGIMLTLEEVEEYLSQEFEQDGTRRLYNNYENENIQGYVEFMKALWDKATEQIATIPRDELSNLPWEERSHITFSNRLNTAYRNLPEEIKEQYNWTNLPFPIVEEMVKKVYDPDYEMQLDEFLLQEV